MLSLVDRAGRPQPGLLRLHDVYDLELGAELVVLSGCRTALGREIRGEGLLSLTRGFFYAGVPRVMASLWSVEDRATSELMVRFYRSLFRDGLAPAAALRSAQLDLRRDRRFRLLVRANLGDSGLMPKSDPVTDSPDVVVNGRTEMDVDELVRNWGKYVWDPKPGLRNVAYGRAASQNIEVDICDAKLRMYYSDAGFAPPPTSWVKIFTKGAGSETSPLAMVGGADNLVEPGRRCANSESFIFDVPKHGHYCIIAMAASEFFSNEQPNITGNYPVQEWIHNNGAAGWHNIDVSTTNEAVLKFYNLDGRPERFIFEAHCVNVPCGTEVSLECNDELLRYSIGGAEKVSRAHQIVSVEGEVPPNFEGGLEVRFKTPDGAPLPPRASVDVRQSWHIPAGHTHYLQAVDQLCDTRALKLCQPVRLGMGNFMFIGPES